MKTLQPTRERMRRRGLTLAELMVGLFILSLVGSAGTYMLVCVDNAKRYVQGTANSASEVDFARERMIENIRSANTLTVSASGYTTITITSPPSALIGGGTFTITYSGVAGGSLLETYVNNAGGTIYSSGVLVHVLTQFSATPVAGNPNAYQIVLGANPTAPVQRTFVAFGRNL